jgi:hypothetical protein
LKRSLERQGLLASEQQIMAGSSQGGVQVGRRKPVTQGDPAREILAGSPTAGDGRLPPTAVWLESGLSTRRFIVAMIVS